MLLVYRAEVSVSRDNGKQCVYGFHGYRYVAEALKVLDNIQGTHPYIMAFLHHGLKKEPADRFFFLPDDGANVVLSKWDFP